MSNHDGSNHDRRIISENPGVYIAMKSAVMEGSGRMVHGVGQSSFLVSSSAMMH